MYVAKMYRGLSKYSIIKTSLVKILIDMNVREN